MDMIGYTQFTAKLSTIFEFLKESLNAGEKTMDIAGFLLASGFALVVVLLGWANTITTKSKETKDLEDDFLEKAKLKKSEYKKMIEEGGATDDSFAAVVNFLYSDQEDNVVIFEKIKRIRDELKSLDVKYGRRFWILLFMSISFLVSGIVAFFLDPAYQLWALVPSFIFVVVVICNLITVHNLEKKYIENISEAMRKL